MQTVEVHQPKLGKEVLNMLTKIKYYIAAITIPLASVTYADNGGPPLDCGYKTNIEILEYLQETSEPDHLTNINTLVRDGMVAYDNDHWVDLSESILSFIFNANTGGGGYSLKGPSYLLQGESYRFKYDGNTISSAGRNYTVLFGTSEANSTVDTLANWENNAYKHLTFDNTYGVGIVWTDGKECLTKTVIVQKPPTISKVSVKTLSNINVKVNASIDQYSKYAQEGIQGQITYSFHNRDTNTTETVTTTSQDFSFTPRYNGDIIVSASIFDGTYSKGVSFGIVFYEGSDYCRTCGHLN